MQTTVRFLMYLVILVWPFYSALVGVRSIVISPSVFGSVCLSVCRWAYLWNRWTDLHEILCADPVWPWLSTSCTSGFMDDVTFGRNGLYGIVWPGWVPSWTSRQLPAWPGRSLMSMNVLFAPLMLTSAHLDLPTWHSYSKDVPAYHKWSF